MQPALRRFVLVMSFEVAVLVHAAAVRALLELHRRRPGDLSVLG